MPNTGKPSKDCFSCRQRRIKCDLVRPGCTQCARLRKMCPGYRDETSLRFRNSNTASFELKSRTGRRLKLHYYHQPGSTGGTRDTNSRPNNSLPVELPQTLSRHVIPLVLDKFSIGPKAGIFATVNRMVSIAGQTSPIYAVSNAIAYAYRASYTGSPTARSDMFHAYGTALRTVKAALDDPVEYKKDSTLLAVWMFVVYEFLSNANLTTIAASEQGERHCRGMASLISVRGSEQFSMQQGRDLVWFVCLCAQIKALIARRESPPHILKWIHQLGRQTSEYALSQTCTFACHCTQFCSRIKGLLLGTPEQLVLNASSVIQQMEEVEKMRSALDTSASSGVFVYQETFQLHLSENMLMFLSTIATQAEVSSQQRTQFSQVQKHCISMFQRTASGILIIDYHSVGWGDSVMVLAGLLTVSTSHISLPVQRDTATKILGIIKGQSGFRISNA
uniref:White-opaque regulator 1 n=1 Tax=Talaromyces marneffei PM1 TaxID=1077442 RepID=A0A093UPJ3_TALMA